MTTVKSFILVTVVLVTVVFIVLGYREIKKNEKRSFGDLRVVSEEEKTYSFEEIVNSITNQ